MFNTAPKRIGWFCVFCIVIIGGWFTATILMPSLAATPANVPVWKIQVTPWAGDQHIAFTPDGKQVLDSFSDRRNKTHGIRRWDVASGKELAPITSEGKIPLLSKNGMFYAIFGKQENQSPKIRIYRVLDQKQIGEILASSIDGTVVEIIGTKPLIVIQHLQNTAVINSPSIQRSYSFWDVTNKKFLQSKSHQTTLYDTYSFPEDVAFSNDGTKAYSLWTVFTQTSKGKTSQYAEGLEPWPDNSLVGKPKEAWLLNEVNGKIVKLPFSKQTPGIQFIWKKPALSKDEALLAATSTNDPGGWSDNGEDGSVRCYDLPHQKLRWVYYKKHNMPDKFLFSPDGMMLANGGYDNEYNNNGGYLNILNTKTGKLIHSFTEQTLWQQISDRTRKFITDKAYGTSFLKKQFGKSMEKYYRKPPPGNSGLPISLAWSPDSKMLAAAYADGSMKLWRVNK